MNYIESVSDFFKSPKWVTNLLFAGLCMLTTAIIPIVGGLVVLGWLVTGFWARQDERMETFPDFDFGQLMKYLERGLWPLLTSLVGAVAVGLTLGLVIFLPLVILGALFAGGDGFISGFFGLIIGLLSLLGYVVVIGATMLVATPLAIRGALMQDFVPAFDIPFLKRFTSLMWKETLLASLFLIVASMVLSLAGFVALCIGVFAAMAVTHFAWIHLCAQLYKLYLARGGEPVPVSPKLADGFLAKGY